MGNVGAHEADVGPGALDDRGHGDLDPARLAARERTDLVVAPVGEADALEERIDARASTRLARESGAPVVLARYEALLTHWWEHGIARDGVERLAPIGTG